MIQVRKSDDRGHANFGWLDTRYTFSFSEYHDPQYSNFHTLRVINEDIVQPGKGFGLHPHKDMEILTSIVGGALEHRDSMGNGSIIRPGDWQRMSAGTGIRHSEFNPSQTDNTHLLQIWILPKLIGIKPSYEERTFPTEGKLNKLCLIASPDARDNSLWINQDVELYNCIISAQNTVDYQLNPANHAWVHVIRGTVGFNGLILSSGDGAGISGEKSLIFNGQTEAEFILFDMK